MNHNYNLKHTFNAYTKDAAAGEAVTATLTPASGEFAVISQVAVHFDADPEADTTITIKSGSTTLWKAYVLLGARNDSLAYQETWIEGLTNHVVDEALTIAVTDPGGTVAATVNVMKDKTTTGS